MSIPQITITGVILAGGLARRMNHQDKGLVLYHNIPLISYAISAMSPVVNELLINANRHHAEYARFGLPVIADQSDCFDGPLAGVLTAMLHSKGEVLVVMPCDSPLIKSHHLEKLISTLQESNADCAVAFDGERLHPVILAVKTCLKNSVAAFLNSGERKIGQWVTQQNFVKVDFSDAADIFLNLNTLSELSQLEQQSLETAKLNSFPI
jgi:molybdopterin-guanine dinucleotide biosynthesis protein A